VSLRPPADWRRPVGRPRTTWLRTIDDDLQALNFGVHKAWGKARDTDVCIKSSVLQQSTLEFANKERRSYKTVFRTRVLLGSSTLKGLIV